LSKQEEETQKSHIFMGIKFPWYFKNPRWVQTGDKSFTIAVDNSNWPPAKKAQWNQIYLPELAALAKLVLEKKLSATIKPL